MRRAFSYNPERPRILIVGNYGSGKTEVAVHLALHLAEKPLPLSTTSPESRGPALNTRRTVKIVDLDIVNPYFRCREAREELESRGIEVIYPKGEFHSADLPIILPEVKGAIAGARSPKNGEPGSGSTVIFDVGGDDVGARVLSSLKDLLEGRERHVLQVINACRPFTSDVAGCRRIRQEIEAASRLAVTGIISNTHLMDETDADTFHAGLKLAREVAEDGGLSLEFATVPETLIDEIREEDTGCPLLPITRRMLPPWKLESMTDRAGRVLRDDA